LAFGAMSHCMVWLATLVAVLFGIAKLISASRLAS
jgi:hypothetical protein